jgi:hypothetical protein
MKKQEARVGDLVMPNLKTGSSYARPTSNFVLIEGELDINGKTTPLIKWFVSPAIVIKVVEVRSSIDSYSLSKPTNWLTILVPPGKLGSCFDYEVYVV